MSAGASSFAVWLSGVLDATGGAVDEKTAALIRERLDMVLADDTARALVVNAPPRGWGSPMEDPNSSWNPPLRVVPDTSPSDILKAWLKSST